MSVSTTSSTAHSSDAVRLKERLRHELRWLRLRLAGHAALMFLGSAGLLLAAAVITLNGWAAWGPWGARVVQMVLVGSAAWIFFFELMRPLRRIANLKGFSRQLEEHGDYNNMLEAATQFTSPKRRDPLVHGASPELVAEILRRASDEAEKTALSPRVPLVGAHIHAGLAALALVVWMVLGWGAPERVQQTFTALAHPNYLARITPTSGLFSLTEDMRVAVGGEVRLQARDFLGGDEDVYLLVNRTGDFWQEVPTVREEATLDPAPYVDVTGRLVEVEDPFRYRFRKGELLTPVYQLSVRERPVIKSLAARLEPPAYTGREATEREDLGGTIAVLEGTMVHMVGQSSAPLASARRLDDGQEPRSLPIDDDVFSDEFAVTSDMSFRIGLTDSEGLESDAVTVYRFAVQSDDPPTVQITEPGDDRTLDRDLTIPVAGLAADDVGLASLDLLHRSADETEWTRTRLYTPGQEAPSSPQVAELIVEEGSQEVGVVFLWDLNELELFPGDTVVYCLEATDNNALVGGQSARSAVYRLRLPTISEVFDIERDVRDEQAESLTDLLSEGEELEENLERLDRELKKNPSPDFAKQEEIREALEQQKELHDRLEDSNSKLQQQLEDFQRNNAGSMEIMEKMEVIQELMDSLDDQGLRDYMEAMQDAMDQLQPHEIQRAMEEALANQEEYNRRLDRTIELLQQLERDRLMSDLIEEVADYLSRQEDLQDQVSELDEESQEQLDQLAQNDTAENDESGDASGEGDESESSEDAAGEESGESGEETDGSESESSESEGSETEDSESEGSESEGSESEDSESEGSESEGSESESSESEGSESESSESEGSESESSESEGSESESSESSESQSSESSESASPEQSSEKPKTLEELAEAQQQLAEEAEELRERVQEALDRIEEQKEANNGQMDPGMQEMKQALEQAMQALNSQDNPSDPMQKAAESLAAGDPQEGAEQQDQARENLVHLYEVLAEGQQGMQMATQQYATEKLQALAYDMLNLSFSEEKIVEALRETVQGQQLRPITREQGRIQRSTNRIYADLEELSRKNFMISEQLLEQLKELTQILDRSVNELNMARSRRSRDTATTTMGSMNQIVMNLLTAAKNSGGQGGGGGEQMSMSQQMEQMSQEQSRLNSMTDQLRERMQGGFSEQERQELAKLRARQQSIAQQLKELRDQVDDERRILGDLDKLGEEIEEVVQDFDSGTLSDSTRRQQEKILSRLLDAQRSIRERDFAKRRESREGQELFAPQAGSPLARGSADNEQQLRRWLAPEKAPHDYQDDVRRYFRQIQGKLDAGGDK